MMKHSASPADSDSPFRGAWMLLYAVAATLLLRGYLYGLVNPVEVPSLEALIDPALFPRDYIVQESLRFSPRFYYFRLLAGLSPTLAALPWIVFGAYAIAVAGLLTGLAALAREIGGGRGAVLLLAWWGLTSVAGSVGGVFLFTNGPVPAVLAAPFAVWGLAFCARRNWLPAYACFGAAVLLQFLVGFIPGLLALPLVLWRRRESPWHLTALGIGLWGATLATVYLPMVLAGTTGGTLTLSEFMDTYAHLRHPHHVLPSTWGALVWLQWTTFQFGYVLWLRTVWHDLNPGVRALLVGFLVGGAVLLCAAFLGVEVWPVRVVATLQLARVTPFTALLGCGIVALVAPREWQAGNRGTALLLCIAPLTRFAGVLLLAAWLLRASGRARQTVALCVAAPFAAGALAVDRGVAGGWVEFSLWLAIPVAWALPGWLQKRLSRGWVTPSLAALAVGALAAGLCAEVPVRWQRQWRSHLSVELPVLTTLDGIGRAARQVTPKDALILTPIADEIYRFKLHAQRSSVVDFKHNAFSEASMIEWRRRLERIAGQRITSGDELDEAWQRRSGVELARLAQEFGAGYVLTLETWHPELPGERVARCGDWVLWSIGSKTDSPAP